MDHQVLIENISTVELISSLGYWPEVTESESSTASAALGLPWAPDSRGEGIVDMFCSHSVYAGSPVRLQQVHVARHSDAFALGNDALE